MMNQFEITSDWIDRYHDGDLNAEEVAYLLEMQKKNPLLRAEMVVDQELNEFLSDADMIDLFQKLRSAAIPSEPPTVRSRLFLVAACLLVLLTTGYLGFLFRFETARYYRVLTGFNQGLEKETLNPLFHGATPVAIQTRGISPVGRREIMKERLLAASFCPLPEFESLVGAVTRSVIMQIERPGEEIHRLCGSEILFKWNEMTGPGLVLITLFNNKGIRITEVPVPYGNSWVLRTTGLPGGLYYWRITRDDELIILGKIILH